MCALCYSFSDDYWDTRDAQVICKALGYDPEYAVATIKSTFGSDQSEYIMDNVNCTGTESSIFECQFLVNNNCEKNEAAGVVCGTKNTENLEPFVLGNKLLTFELWLGYSHEV